MFLFFSENENIDLDIFSSSASEEAELSDYEFEDISEERKDEPSDKKRKYSRGRKEIITEKLSLLLDRCKISDREAVRIISATAEGFGHDVQNLTISRSTVRLRRQKFRKQRALLIKNRFRNSDVESAVLHWDSKLLPGILNKGSVERLAVLISCGEEEQLIGVPELENSKGITQAKAVFSELEQWGAVGNIKGMCFDTTAVNTGRLNGTCVLLEQLLEKNLLYLPCRHHILEVVLKSIFDCKMGSTTGPQPEIFKRFQAWWPNRDITNYKSGLENEKMRRTINNPEQISSFLLEQLKHQQPRDDYKEFLQLSLVFLGCIKEEEFSFRVPGAIHHARWMAKAIYSLKIYIFRHQFPLTDSENNGIEELCLFIITGLRHF